MKILKVSSNWSLTVWVFIFSATKSKMMPSIRRLSFWTVFSPYSALQKNQISVVLICTLLKWKEWDHSVEISRFFCHSEFKWNQFCRTCGFYSCHFCNFRGSEISLPWQISAFKKCQKLKKIKLQSFKMC